MALRYGMVGFTQVTCGDRAKSEYARHGHKTSARGFDGYKGHVPIDPGSGIITATAVTPGNSGDAEAAGPDPAAGKSEDPGQPAV
jgi:hypothetical protein